MSAGHKLAKILRKPHLQLAERDGEQPCLDTARALGARRRLSPHTCRLTPAGPESRTTSSKAQHFA